MSNEPDPDDSPILLDWWGFVKDANSIVSHYVPCTQEGVVINWHATTGYDCWCQPYMKRGKKPYIQHRDPPHGGYHC